MGKRGRPVGVKNGEGTSVLAPIKNWKSKHELIVQLHLMQMSASDIQKYIKTHYGKQISTTRISQVLNDPQAKARIEARIEKMKEAAAQSIDDELLFLAEQGVQRLSETIRAPFNPGSDAKKHQDNMAMQLVKPFMRASETEREKEPGIPVRLFDRLVSALEGANEARTLPGQPISEGDFEVVESASG